ncbi:hypothetical protein ABR738_37545 [Streptomyces sp. Edi4]|uniref:hypothetical protein n=1 Tax=Streptomyces sp. Edi4 TaxID=3162527 RepID=UPI00330592D0
MFFETSVPAPTASAAFAALVEEWARWAETFSTALDQDLLAIQRGRQQSGVPSSLPHEQPPKARAARLDSLPAPG